MNVKLLAHTQLSEGFKEALGFEGLTQIKSATDGQAVALTAIRTCYSANKPSEIVAKEGAKYFGEGGTEAERLFRMIFRSKHLSTVEHLSYTFAVEGVSRALLAQLTRHRVGFSFSVQSQRYVRMGSDDRSGGFDYVVPEKVADSYDDNAQFIFEAAMQTSQRYYDDLRKAGVPPEDARAVLPNAAATNLVMTANLRALLDFYAKRRAGRGGQFEITQLAEELRKAVVDVEPWVAKFFEEV